MTLIPMKIPSLVLKELGFTLLEALVAMAIFMLGFSGLYFFYGITQQSIVNSEKRMYLNFMGDRIIQTIAARAHLPINDLLNPFNGNGDGEIAIYSGSMNTCNSLTGDLKIWCDELNLNVGSYNPSSSKESRVVNVVRDGANIVVNVSLVVDDGNVSAFYTRKLRP